MRIAYVLTQDRGGPVDVAVHLARELVSSGRAEVRIFGPPPARCDPEVVPMLDHAPVVSKFRVGAMGRLLRAIEAWAPDVVHSHDRRAMLVVSSSSLLSSLRARRVGTYHGLPADVTDAWFRSVPGAAGPSKHSSIRMAMDAALARRLDRLIVPTRALRRFVSARLGLAESHVEHIDNGVPVVDPAPADRPVRRLLYAGVLVEPKGLLGFLEAMARVRADGVDVELWIAGSGPQREALDRRVTGLGLCGSVVFLGFRPDVGELMRACDAVVLPSMMEQQPVAIIEAMMAGKPVLATRVGGVPEMFGDVDVHGLLVTPGDVGDLTRGLRRLVTLERPGEVGSCYAAAARARFDVRATAEAHVRLYRALVRPGTRC